MVKKEGILTIAIVLVLSLAAFVLAAAGQGPTLVSPTANQNISGSLLVNVTADFAGGDGNYTNVTIYFFNGTDASQPLVYNLSIQPDDATNLTFNSTISTASVLPDGIYNISLNATNASDGSVISNSSIFASAASFILVDNVAPHVQGFNSPADRVNYTTTTNISVTLNVSVSNSTLGAAANVSALETVIFEVANGTPFNLTASSTNDTLFNATLATASLDEGNWSIRIYANDTAGNMNSSELIYIVVDRSAPTALVSCNDVNVGQLVTCTCSGTENENGSGLVSATFGSSGSTTESFSPTIAGTFTSDTCNAVDEVGLIGTATTSYTVSSTSSGGGSSGGGGGASTSTSNYAQSTWSSLPAQEKATLAVNKQGLAVTAVSFTASEQMYGIWLKASVVEQLPSTVQNLPAERAVYSLARLTKSNNFDEAQTSGFTVDFEVTKAWLAQEGLTPGQVSLYRYVADEWVELDTSVNSQVGDVVSLTAVTPGFSYFAIAQASDAQEEVAEVVAQEETASLEDLDEAVDAQAQESASEQEELQEKSSKLWIWFVVIALLLLAGLLWYIKQPHKRR